MAVPGVDSVDYPGVNIESHDPETLPRGLNGERKSDISQPDHPEGVRPGRFGVHRVPTIRRQIPNRLAGDPGWFNRARPIRLDRRSGRGVVGPALGVGDRSHFDEVEGEFGLHAIACLRETTDGFPCVENRVGHGYDRARHVY